MDTVTAKRDLDDFYSATYPRLVAIVGSIAGSRDEAEEAVQDAFVRLLGRWEKVSRYENPEAWVRKAAIGNLSKRRRKFQNGLRATLRLGPPLDVPGPTGDSIDLARALDQLPVNQRAVVILHRLGLDLETIALELSVPVGTVKSRLSRARKALAPLLREDTTDYV